MKSLLPLLFLTLFACSNKPYNELYASSHTNIKIVNKSKSDSVKVYLTIQSPNSVIGMFGIKDTTGSKSQGYFYAFKDSSYLLNSSEALYGFNISFEAPPMACDKAISSGYPNGINIFEGSINCPFEVFDISCIDGANCVLRASVTDTLNWSTGMDTLKQTFRSAENSVELESNCGVRGVFPYRCSDCIQINPKNKPKNCFDLPVKCSNNRTCQVARTDHNGGTIILEYFGNEAIGQEKNR